MSRLNGYWKPPHQAEFHLQLQGRYTPITHERRARGYLQLKPGGWIYSLEPTDLAELWAMSSEHLKARLSSCNWKCTHKQSSKNVYIYISCLRVSPRRLSMGRFILSCYLSHGQTNQRDRWKVGARGGVSYSVMASSDGCVTPHPC